MGGRETGLMQRLRDAWYRAGSPQSVLVAYSGGADSLALLALLRDLARVESLSLTAAHVDHGARASSAAEAHLVEAIAERLAVPICVRRIPEGAFASHPDVGPEEAMRRERYRILAEVAREEGSAVVAVAHHQGDQAETVLLHLLRGAGLPGVSAMREISRLPVPWWEDRPGDELVIWRPLLGEPAALVRGHATSLDVPIIEDPTNVEAAFRRNAIRHRVVPVLNEVVPGAEATLARFAALAAIDSDELDRQADLAAAPLMVAGALRRPEWVVLRPAIRGRVLRLWLTQELPGDAELSMNRLDAVFEVASRPGPVRRVELGGGWSVEVTREWLRARHDDVPQR